MSGGIILKAHAQGFVKSSYNRLELSLCFLLIASVFVLIFLLSHCAIFDLDIWLHLKSGEVIANSLAVPLKDIFSFTVFGKAWIDHSWLFQLLSYLTYSLEQAEGLIFLQGLVVTLSFLILFLTGLRLSKSYLEAGIFLLFTADACVIRFNIRPEIFSLLLFALFLHLLFIHIESRRMFWLIPLQLLWVNLHGYFFLGPLLASLFLLAELFRRRLKNLPWHWNEGFVLSDTAYRRLLVLLPLLILVCLINPNGLRGAAYPFAVLKEFLFGTAQIFSQYIQELQPTLQSAGIFSSLYNFIILTVVCFLVMAFNLKRLKIIDIMLALLFFCFSLAIRNIAFFAFIAYLILTSYLVDTVTVISAHIKIKTQSSKTGDLRYKYALIVVLIIYVWLRIGNTLGQQYYDFSDNHFKSNLTGINSNNYPAKAVNFILRNNIPGNIFNNFNSGAYLIGKAFPAKRVFIDGRTELYGAQFFKNYIDIMQGNGPLFDKTATQYGFNAILVGLDTQPLPQILSYIYNSRQWKLVFLDGLGIVFVKDIPLNRELINKFGIDLKEYKAPRLKLVQSQAHKIYPSVYLQRASLFYILHEDKLVIAECQEALRIMPDCFLAHYLIAKVYLGQKSYLKARLHLQAAVDSNPRNAEALTDLGFCLGELKRGDAAIKMLKSALKLACRYSVAHYYLGCIYLMDNKFDQAIQSLTQAIKYAPFNQAYYFKLGQAFYNKDIAFKNKSDFKEAKQAWNTAYRLSIQNRDSQLTGEIKEKIKELNPAF